MKKPYITPTTKVRCIYPKNSYGIDTLSVEVVPDNAKRGTWFDSESTSEESKNSGKSFWSEW